MANTLLVTEIPNTSPAQILFRDVTDYAPAAANVLTKSGGTPTAVQIDMTGVANNAARQSDKVDLGAVRAPSYAVRAAFELAATPTAGNLIKLYWAPSQSATAGTANAGGVSGADSAYAGYSANLDAALRQLIYIGPFVCTAQATGTVQIGEVQGILAPTERYGTLIIDNDSGAAFHSDAVEISVVFDPIVPELQ